MADRRTLKMSEAEFEHHQAWDEHVRKLPPLEGEINYRKLKPGRYVAGNKVTIYLRKRSSPGMIDMEYTEYNAGDVVDIPSPAGIGFHYYAGYFPGEQARPRLRRVKAD